MIERDNYCNQEEINKGLKNQIENYEKLQEKYEKEITDLKVSFSTLKLQNDNLIENNEQLKRDLEIEKLGKSNLLGNLLKDDDENNNNNINNKNNNNILIKQNISPIFIKFSYRKDSKPKKTFKKLNFDFLGLKKEEVIIRNLEDEYYNPNEGFVFSEIIKYIDPENDETDCILFITQTFLYLLNKNTFKKCFSISIILLKTINASTDNNIISLIFDTGEILIFEIFRFFEFINFFKTMNAIERGNNYAINVNGNNNKNFDKKKKIIQRLLFMEMPFYLVI